MFLVVQTAVQRILQRYARESTAVIVVCVYCCSKMNVWQEMPSLEQQLSSCTLTGSTKRNDGDWVNTTCTSLSEVTVSLSCS